MPDTPCVQGVGIRIRNGILIVCASLQIIVATNAGATPFSEEHSRSIMVSTAVDIQVTEKGSVTGTVKSVDQKTRTLEVISGVGHSLQLVRVQVGADARITREGTAGRLDDLKRGDVVRVEYRKTADGNVGERIKVVRSTVQGNNRR